MDETRIEVAPFHMDANEYNDIFSYCGKNNIEVTDVEHGSGFLVKFHGPNGWDEAEIKLQAGQALAQVTWLVGPYATYPERVRIYRCLPSRQWWNPQNVAPERCAHSFFWYVPDPGRVGFCTK